MSLHVLSYHSSHTHRINRIRVDSRLSLAGRRRDSLLPGGHKELRGTRVEPVKELEVSLEPHRLIHLLPYTQRCRLQLDRWLIRRVEGAGLSGDKVSDVLTPEGLETATLRGLVVVISLALSVLES